MSKKCYIMSIRLTLETRDDLRNRAEAERRDPSDLVRLWILDELRRGDEKPCSELERN